MRKRPLLAPRLFAVLVLATSMFWPALGQNRWRSPDGGFLPFASEAEVLDFLHEAEVIKKKEIPQGINKALKVRLRKDGVEAHAIYRTVNIKKLRHQTAGQIYIDFRDSYIYECGAYELSRLLGIDHVPPCVVRDLGRHRGTMQIWVEKAMTETDRHKKNLKAPFSIHWARQQQTMRLFDGLINNIDRNQGNILIDPEWKLWFIDHTRSFHKSSSVEKLERIIWVERRLWTNLQALSLEKLASRLSGLVDKERINYVFQRKEALVRHLESRIALLGEGAVVYEGGGSGD